MVTSSSATTAISRTMSILPSSGLPELFLLRNVILEYLKPDWNDEFDKEKNMYSRLESLQGHLIPICYGEAVYEGSRALILPVLQGVRLFEQDIDCPLEGCTIRKSVRIGRSSLGAEKRYLQPKTSVPVPSVRQYYVSEEFEHLTMNKMPGRTLETVWPTLSLLERESIAGDVASLVEQLRKLYFH
ncbi:hypothetical protein QQZ08_003718 [Neonectria magnoliae]|uniref:Uncharacterized protein n=1 Tax=Neonectria magnoliae TaxID=2732573 RepID=A0ABR1IA94_9HYPO